MLRVRGLIKSFPTSTARDGADQAAFLSGAGRRRVVNAVDLDLAAGFCGSVSGSVYVTVGQPHIKVDSITVGGR